MSLTSIFQWTKKNLVTIIALGCVIAYVVWVCMHEIDGMNNAATSYDYCHHLCRLFEHIGKTVFVIIYGIICYLTYSKKQYSKWSLWLFYISAVAILVHYFVAGQMFVYVCHHIGAENMDKIPSLAVDIYGAPAFFIILSFCFMPKIIKDTLKLKQEQELTI